MTAQNRTAQPAVAELSDLNLEVVSAGKSPARLGRWVGGTFGAAAGEQFVPSLLQNATATVVSGALGS